VVLWVEHDRAADSTRKDAAHDATPLQWCLYRHAELADGWGHDDVERIFREHGATS
jgi:hypothetical protein